jgi:F1F0 ATPase subunit 2
MNGFLLLMASGVAGVLLGLVFFWGLWVTVNRIKAAGHPAILMLGSMLLRFALVLAAFYLLARYGGWEHLLAAVAGFTLLRIFLVWRVQTGQIK